MMEEIRGKREGNNQRGRGIHNTGYLWVDPYLDVL